jgi:glycerol-3-phosphate dehydrogenase
MLDEGDKLVPKISDARVLRAWAGVRPLYQEDFAGESRDATRALALLDHAQRDAVRGILTITGGKWTTFRLMAELTVDKACEQLGVQRTCRTASTPVPGVEHGHYWLGHRLHEVEANRLQGTLVCECELVTRAMLESAAADNPTLTIDDLRRDVRLGMGPCQGGFCTYRAVGILHENAAAHDDGSSLEAPQPDVKQSNGTSAWDISRAQSPQHAALSRSRSETAPRTPALKPNLLLRDFLQERWKGITPILWGQQLRQERLDQLLYLCVMNADHLPDEEQTGPMSEFYKYNPVGDVGGE